MVVRANAQNTATLGNSDGFTEFRFRDVLIRFRAPYSLERYTRVKQWDAGYLVADAKYSHNSDDEEEYIDLVPILKDLYIDSDVFLSPIKNVEVAHA